MIPVILAWVIVGAICGLRCEKLFGDGEYVAATLIGAVLAPLSLFLVTSDYWLERGKLGHRKSDTRDRGQAGAVPAPERAIQAAINAVAAGEAGASTRVVVEQEILAERGWNLGQAQDGTPALWSYSRPVLWDGPTLIADRSPGADTPHGIYAQGCLDPCYSECPVVGVVALSGIVVEGERGYRAERATIRFLRLRALPRYQPLYDPLGSLSLPVEQVWRAPAWRVAEQLAERYQCDVTIDWLSTSNLPATELTV